MADVFISYASADRDRAQVLAVALEARGWSVWWDRKIIAGQSYDQVIERELHNAKSVVVLWSKNSVASEWVKNEAGLAVERDVLVPATIDDVRPPLEFRRRQTASLTGWDGAATHAGFQSLCDGVNLLLGGKTAPLASQMSPVVLSAKKVFKRIALAVLILVLGFGVYFLAGPTGSPVSSNGAASATLADLASGTYTGGVIADSQGPSQSDVTVTLSKIDQRKVRVQSDYHRLRPTEVNLTKVRESIQSADSGVILSINLTEQPPRLDYNPGGVAYVGTRVRK